MLLTGGETVLRQLNDVLDEIENHLLEEDIIERAIKKSCMSELHFKNIFFFLSGMTINEYVKKR